MGKQRKHKTVKGVVRCHGASFKLIETGRHYETNQAEKKREIENRPDRNNGRK